MQALRALQGPETTSIATRKQHLVALRHFFDGMSPATAIVLNPALSVRVDKNRR
jgi:hypothetical protein